jgi:hypothetical protein
MPQRKEDSEMGQQQEDGPSVWPPPIFPLEESDPQKTLRLMTGARSLDFFAGLFFGAIPLWILLQGIVVFGLAGVLDGFSDAEMKIFLVVAAALLCLLYWKVLAAFRIVLVSSLAAACVTGAYLAWVM